MPDELHSIHFGNIVLEMEFKGSDYGSASVAFKTISKDRLMVLEESPAIPVNCLHDISFLVAWSLRRNKAEVEQEALRIEGLNYNCKQRRRKKNGKESH